MEFIRGRSIDAFCREQALGLPARLRLLLQVVRAVAYAHGRLVLHRDIKPANVLVSQGGQAHLLDFGIATLLGAGEAAVPASGAALTPHYAAPEQLAGEAPAVQADIYSLGVLMRELLTGIRLPAEIRAVLARATQAAAADRYASAEALADDIERHLRGDTVSALHGGAFYRLGKLLRRHWVGASAVAVPRCCWPWAWAARPPSCRCARRRRPASGSGW